MTDAASSLERFISEASAREKGLGPERRRDAQKLLAEIKSKMARLELVVVPASAELKLDGKTLPSPLPATPLELDPGAHVLEIAASGHSQVARTLELKPGSNTTFRYELRPLGEKASIAANSTPALVPATAPATVSTTSATSRPGFFATVRGRATLALGAVSLASFVVAGGTGGAALSARNSYREACGSGNCNQAQYDSGRHLAIASDVFLSVGIVTAVVTTLVAVTAPHERKLAFAPALGPSFGGLALSGRF